MEANQFIGPRKVIALVLLEESKTPSGGDVIRVEFDGGYSKVMTKKGFDTLVTDAPTDFNVLDARLMDAVLPATLAVLLEYGLTIQETNRLIKKVVETVEDHLNRAANYLITGDDSTFSAGVNMMDYQSLVDIDRILKSIPPVPATASNDPKPEENSPTAS